MFELIWRQLFNELRPTVVTVIDRLHKRTDKNEKIELFCQKNAERFLKDPRGIIRFVLYFGICFGWVLRGNANQEIEDLFNVNPSDVKKDDVRLIH